MAEIVLVVVAHSDDESISMAGTIRKHVDNGDTVFVVSMTNGVGARNRTTKNEIMKREESATHASKILGFNWSDCYNFTDNSMDSHPLLDVVKAVENAKIKHKPTLVYTHSGADLNIDHRVVCNAVLTAFRPLPNETCKEIRLFEVASATDYGHSSVTGTFSPNLFINIAANWDVKFKALRAYATELRDYPHSRSVEAIMNLARIRGNQVGLELAEAFEVVRKIDK